MEKNFLRDATNDFAKIGTVIKVITSKSKEMSTVLRIRKQLPNSCFATFPNKVNVIITKVDGEESKSFEVKCGESDCKERGTCVCTYTGIITKNGRVKDMTPMYGQATQ